MAAPLEVTAETARASDKASNYELALRLTPEEFQITWPMGCPNDLAVEGAQNDSNREASDSSTPEQQREPLNSKSGAAAEAVGNNISTEDSTAVWTHEATLYLIGSCESRKHLFHVPGVKKMDIWKQIADEMQSFGLSYSWEACEKKMRNLKYRYKLLTNSGNKCCKGRRPWIYYDAIDSIVTSDPNMSENQIKDSLALGNESEFQVSWRDGALEGGIVLECSGNEGEDMSESTSDEQSLKLPKGIKIVTESLGSNMDLSMPTEDTITNAGWTHELTLMLIRACRERQHLFNTPGIKKMDIWKQVADAMQAHGTSFSWEACEKKMRNLKYRYKLILNGNEKKSKSRKQWEYFDAIDGLMADNSVAEHSPVTVHNQNVQMKAGVKRKGDFCNFFFTQEVPTKSVLLTHATRSTMNSRRQKTSSSCHSTESPPWFREFAREQRRCLEDIIKINKEALKVAKERNNILQAFTEAFLKQESYAERKLSSTSKDCHGE